MDRITSLERFGARCSGDFSAENLRKIREAGFNAVFVNGGCGFGPDSFFVESMIATESIPDLMPYTVAYVKREMHRRFDLLAEYELKPYFCIWDTLGTQHSSFIQSQYIDRHTKLELRAKQNRTPELFGKNYSWKISDPLCVSHETVQAFYDELFRKLTVEYPQLTGVMYFPGDFSYGICTDECPRCKATGLTQQERMIRHINHLRAALDEKVSLYYAFWNIEQPGAVPAIKPEIIEQTLCKLSSDIGVGITINDNVTVERRGCSMTYLQPWGTFVQKGDLFQKAVDLCREQNRKLMVFSEITQSEQYDPVCSNMPFALKTLSLYRTLAEIPEVDSLVDFWGARPPYLPDACHAVQRNLILHPEKSDDEILRCAVMDHYCLSENDPDLIERGLSVWKKFDEVLDSEALCGWSSRLSFAVGRCGGHGQFFLPLIPQYLRSILHSWGAGQISFFGTSPQIYFDRRNEDAGSYLACANEFRVFAERLKDSGSLSGAENAAMEALQMELYGKVIVSVARTLLAAEAFERKQNEKLRSLILDEIVARQDLMELSRTLQPYAGIDLLLAEEDIMNMGLYLSDDSFPDSPDTLFSVTQVILPA